MKKCLFLSFCFTIFAIFSAVSQDIMLLNNTPSIADVKMSIQQKSHLPMMPSAESLVENGYELKSMDAKLLAQIEWLWQHTIKLDAENKKLKEELAEIKSIISTSEPKK